MKEPERYLKYDLKQRPFLAELLEPVVLLSDIETLLKKKATHQPDGAIDFVFEKAGVQDRKPWAFRIWVDQQQRLNKFQLPYRFSEILGNDFIVEGMRAVGYTEVSINKRRAYLAIASEISKTQMLELMGAPATQAKDSMSYRFDEDKTVLNISMLLVGEQIKSALLEANGYSLEVTFQKDLKR